jgi:hypothetical protein
VISLSLYKTMLLDAQSCRILVQYKPVMDQTNGHSVLKRNRGNMEGRPNQELIR